MAAREKLQSWTVRSLLDPTAYDEREYTVRGEFDIIELCARHEVGHDANFGVAVLWPFEYRKLA